MYKVYGLLDPESREIRYIGVTKKSIKSRIRKHLRRVRKRKEQGEGLTYKQNWLDTFVEDYNADEVPYVLIDEYENRDKAYEAETKLIKETDNLINYIENTVPPYIRKRSRSPLSEETKKKIGKANSGESNGMYGKSGEENPASREEVREKISKKLKESEDFQEARYSDEWKENMRKSRGMAVYIFDEDGVVDRFESCTAAAEWLDCTRGNVKNARRNERKIYGKYRVIAEKDLQNDESGYEEQIS